MKKALLLFAILLSLVASTRNQLYAASSVINNAQVTIGDVALTPTVTPIAGYFRWRKDVNNFNNSNWITNRIKTTDPIVTIPEINANVVYRIRMGGSFNITLVGDADYSYTSSVGNGSGNTGQQNVLINTFTLINNSSKKPTYTAYYREGDARTGVADNDAGWIPIPTSDNGNTPFFISKSQSGPNGTSAAPVQEGYQFNSFEENGTDMQVLPATTALGRPTNPYMYLGGGYYDTYNPGSITQFGNYAFNSIQSTTRSYADGSGVFGNSETITGPVDVLKFGAEIETGLKFTKKLKAGTIYTFQLFISVPYQGNGRFDGTINVRGYDVSLNQSRSDFQKSVYPSSPATTSIRGAFKTPAVVLPVKLTSFNAVSQAGIPKLTWTTASEINNKGFNVQRSTDSKNFTTVGFVASKVASGNSSSSLDYEFSDLNAGKTGTLYYRLQQEDRDGVVDYSGIKPVNLDGATAVTIGPNPVVSSLTVKNAEQGASYTIYNAAGQSMKAGIVNASTFYIEMPYFPSGMYILKIKGKSSQVTKKFLHK